MTEQKLTQTKKGITMIVDMSVKSINCAKKITFGILTNVLYLWDWQIFKKYQSWSKNFIWPSYGCDEYCINKKARYKMSSFILHTVLLVIIFLLIIFTIGFYCIKQMLR